MKKKFLLIAVFAITLQAQAQIAFHDAVKLQTYVDNTTGKFKTADTAAFNAVCRILKKYLKEPDRSNPVQKTVITRAFETKQQNPFMYSYFTGVTTSGGAAIGKTLDRLASKAGSTDVTTIADGIAKFLVKRTKQELTATFFEKFDEFLDKQKDLQVLFPSTVTVLRSAGDEIYNYNAYLPALREAFESDLESLLPNGYDWTKSNGPWITELQNMTDKRIYVGLKTGFFIGKELHGSQHPGDVLMSLQAMNLAGATPSSDNIDLAKLDPNLPPLLATANLLSQSLRSLDNDRYWAEASELRAFENVDVLVIYFGLLYQQAKVQEIKFADNTMLTSILERAAPDRQSLRNFIVTVKEKIGDVQKDNEELSAAEKKTASQYFQVATSTYNLVKSLSGMPLLTNSSALNSSPTSEVHFYVTQLSSLWSHIESKAYNAAIYDAYAILDTALNKSARRSDLRVFLKYGSFIATVASAESSDDVEAAIEAIALPAGSASIKRKSKSNIALNAYVGLSPGYEQKGDVGRFTFGVSAPIGVAFSKGKYQKTGTKYTEQGSNTFFISLIDLGAVTAYRFNSDDEEALPKLTLSNIFAPGIYYIRGIKKSPVSIGFGGQMGPQLRNVTSSAATVDNSISYSLKFMIAVDIPLLNFKTVPRD